MDGWIIIWLDDTRKPPDIATYRRRMMRRYSIAEWVEENGMDEKSIGISSNMVRFKNPEDATFFQLSFKV